MIFSSDIMRMTWRTLNSGELPSSGWVWIRKIGEMRSEKDISECFIILSYLGLFEALKWMNTLKSFWQISSLNFFLVCQRNRNRSTFFVVALLLICYEIELSIFCCSVLRFWSELEKIILETIYEKILFGIFFFNFSGFRYYEWILEY